jgi:hypothetical protein
MAAILSLSATTIRYKHYKGNFLIVTGTISSAETVRSEDGEVEVKLHAFLTLVLVEARER